MTSPVTVYEMHKLPQIATDANQGNYVVIYGITSKEGAERWGRRNGHSHVWWWVETSRAYALKGVHK